MGPASRGLPMPPPEVFALRGKAYLDPKVCNIVAFLATYSGFELLCEIFLGSR